MTTFILNWACFFPPVHEIYQTAITFLLLGTGTPSASVCLGSFPSQTPSQAGLNKTNTHECLQTGSNKKKRWPHLLLSCWKRIHPPPPLTQSQWLAPYLLFKYFFFLCVVGRGLHIIPNRRRETDSKTAKSVVLCTYSYFMCSHSLNTELCKQYQESK